MDKTTLRFRQVHLDFHTSPLIPGVGSDFDADAFARTLEKAHVDSVTCFARCHHGMLYYDSKQFPERVHPRLVHRDMLKEIIAACHKVDIRVPIYITVQWDYFTAKEHPEWIALDAEGKQIGTKPFEAGFYQVLCVNSPYRDFLKEQIRELFEEMEVDGLFLDILYPTECNCKFCMEKMKAAGIKLHDSNARMAYAQDMVDECKADISAYIRSFSREATVFYNTSHIGVKQRRVKEAYSHFELESLPSGDWGYIHFPVTMRYARTLGLDCLAHTGKFHLEWGDFHSFKNQAALEYECFRMLALGSKCLVGDQMEPHGRLSEPVYELIGNVYGRVKAVEDWCREARPVVDMAVVSPEEFVGGNRGRLAESIMGLETMFDQLGYQFDIIDTHADFEKYALLILPDDITIAETFHKKLSNYLEQGGKLLVTFTSGLDDKKEHMVLTETGVKLLEPSRTLDGELARGILSNENAYVDYFMPNDQIGKALPKTEHVMYIRGTEVSADAGAEVLAEFRRPYFDRDYRHFCSHRQTPSSQEIGTPAVVKNGNVIYISSPIFTIYDARAPRWCREIVKDAVEMLLEGLHLSHNGPTTLLAALNEQEQECRKVLHLLHYIPQKICKEIHTLEDIIPLYGISVSMKEARKITRVALIPEASEIDFEQKADRVSFTVPEISGYQLIEVAYERG